MTNSMISGRPGFIRRCYISWTMVNITKLSPSYIFPPRIGKTIGNDDETASRIPFVADN